MANLANIIPALFVGPNGERLTPEQIKRKQATANSQIAFATDTSPNAGGVASILAKGLAGFSAGRAERSANDALTKNAESSKANVASLLGLLGGGSVAPVGQGATVASPMVAPVQSVAPATNWDASSVNPTLKTGIQETASALGIDPVDLATAISYETGGTFDPTKAGPTTQWGQHKGLIQFGEPQAQKYGVNWEDPIGSQLGPNGAVANYLRDTGVQPGMGLMDIYSAINAGGVGRNNRSDANNGGAPGTVADKVNQQMGGHRAKALALFGGGQAGAEPMQQAPMQTAQAAPTGINPAIVEALSSPYASEQERSVAGLLLNQTMSQQQAAQAKALKQQERQQEIARRQQIAQQSGIDPAYAQDDELWKGATGQIFAAPSTSTVNNTVIDNRTGKPIYQGEQQRQPLMNLGDGTVYDPNAPQEQRFIQAPNGGQKVPDSVRSLEIRAERAGLKAGTPEYNQFMISGGSGGTSLSVGPDGSVQFSQGGAGGKNLTEAQGKDAFFSARMTSAMPTLDKYEQSLMSLPEAAAGSVPGGRFLQSEEYQLAKDAGDDFVATYLRKDSGAALTKEERSEYGNMLLPQPGDKPAVIEAKRIRRQVAAKAIQLGLPQSAVDNMVKSVGDVKGAAQAVPTTAENPMPSQQMATGWKDLGNGVKIRPKGSN